jgi:hypothetical protein
LSKDTWRGSKDRRSVSVSRQAVPSLNQVFEFGTDCDKGVWPFEAATRDGRSAQILFSNGVKAGGSSRCRRFRAPAFSACSFGTRWG